MIARAPGYEHMFAAEFIFALVDPWLGMYVCEPRKEFLPERIW